VDPRQEFLDAILSNLNYEGGCNPVNISLLTGLGWHRQREIVHQYAQNDRRILPPSGLPIGNIQSGFQYLDIYKGELDALTFPSDGLNDAPYPFYDRWADTFNTSTEFVAVDQVRSLGSLAFVATLTSVQSQAWTAPAAQITGLPEQLGIGTPITATVVVPGMELTNARVVWETRGQEPFMGSVATFSPSILGIQWVEVEVQWPDGRRAFAASQFTTTNALPAVTVVATDNEARERTRDPAVFAFTRTGSTASALTVYFTLSGTATKWNDYRRPEGDMPEFVTIPAGATSVTLTLVPVDDRELEGTETVILTLAPNAAYNVGSPDNATITIQDNELPKRTDTGPDTDGDGATDAEEALAGTDPRDPQSVLKITAIKVDSSGLTVSWASVPGKTYVVAFKDDPNDLYWSDMSGPILATGTTTSWTSEMPDGVLQRLFRIVVT
jgi:hypothetical protein